jgi:hypothetical protein
MTVSPIVHKLICYPGDVLNGVNFYQVGLSPTLLSPACSSIARIQRYVALALPATHFDAICSKVHCLADLSGRHRINRVP